MIAQRWLRTAMVGLVGALPSCLLALGGNHDYHETGGTGGGGSPTASSSSSAGGASTGGATAASSSSASSSGGGGTGGASTTSSSSSSSSGTVPPSCQGLPPTCGPAGDEDCCASVLVQGGTFKRSYDDVMFPNGAFPATVADFRLDRFEVTVGRFRQFANAVVAGTGLPKAGSGKHTHLPNGGLNDGAELGWDILWGNGFPPTHVAWDAQLDCDMWQTWTRPVGASDELPINCINWYEAYAFCIWDGGFLPTEAEWNYAAANGAEQREYPWNTGALDSSYAVYDCLADGSGPMECDYPDLLKVGSKPLGYGAGNLADLSGNVYEWILDWYTDPYPTPCINCALLETPSPIWRIFRGGSWNYPASELYVSQRDSADPSSRVSHIGVRCARTP